VTPIEQVASRSWHNELIATAQELAIAAVAHGQPESENPFDPGSALWIQFRATYRVAMARAGKPVVEPVRLLDRVMAMLLGPRRAA
jgi:hypothetical protein